MYCITQNCCCLFLPQRKANKKLLSKIEAPKDQKMPRKHLWSKAKSEKESRLLDCRFTKTAVYDRPSPRNPEKSQDDPLKRHLCETATCVSVF